MCSKRQVSCNTFELLKLQRETLRKTVEICNFFYWLKNNIPERSSPVDEMFEQLLEKVEDTAT